LAKEKIIMAEKQGKEKSKARKIVGKVISAVMIAVLAFLLIIFSISMVKILRGKEASVFGYKIYHILTDSMTPDLPVDSYIIVKDSNVTKVKEGDYVTYVAFSGEAKGWNITHKLICPQQNTNALSYKIVIEDGKIKYYDLDNSSSKSVYTFTYDGNIIYKDIDTGIDYVFTQGIKEGAPIDDPVPATEIKAKYVAKLDMAWLKPFFSFLTSKSGFVIIIAIPLLALAILQVVNCVRNVKKKDTDADDERKLQEKVKKAQFDRAVREEAIKQLAIKEYLASLEKNNNEVLTGQNSLNTGVDNQKSGEVAVDTSKSDSD